MSECLLLFRSRLRERIAEDQLFALRITALIFLVLQRDYQKYKQSYNENKMRIKKGKDKEELKERLHNIQRQKTHGKEIEYPFLFTPVTDFVVG